MGGRGRSRTQRKHFRQSRENVWKRSRSDSEQQQQGDGENNGKGSWEPFATQNPAFDEYYKEQGIVSVEEWDSFNQVLRKPLPAAFRINSSSQFCVDIRSQLENDFMKSLQAESTDGNEVAAIRPLPWYPENFAWQSDFSRNQLRKNQTLERFHKFLKQENEIGNITRQETVSMVPPLLLDVHPDHYILDMCAAPGSKTFQLLEMIHLSNNPGVLPAGMVIANDVDVQRCNLLIHQTKRMCTANLIVTNHEAQHFPSCHLKRNKAKASEVGVTEEPAINQLLFDRVLCDVPCSGDGTLRKAPDIWRKWNVGMGNALHALQVQIAMRGLSLLKVGGRMVYSTCSMNPVENEAVVAELLRKCQGSVELVDVSGELPTLVRRPGLKRWKVQDREVWLSSYKEVPSTRRVAINPSMFPSGKNYEGTSEKGIGAFVEMDDNDASSENVNQSTEQTLMPIDILEDEVSDLPLEHCMRIVPHDQNTGAFFIAVLRKLDPLPSFQKKPISLHTLKHGNDNQIEILLDMKEHEREEEANLVDVRDEQLCEAASDSTILDNEIEATIVDTDSSKMSEENEAEKIQAPGNSETCSDTASGKRKLQLQGKWRGVDPVVFLKEEVVVDKIKSFYGIEESFPFSGHLVTRNSDTKSVKRVYYIAKSVKNVLELNILAGQQLKITSIGLKMFERQTSKEGTSSPCVFRISSEGLPLILPYISKQILSASPVDFKHLLQYKSIKFSEFVDKEFGETASNLMMGCCIVVLRKDGENSVERPQIDASTISMGCWRGRTNVSIMVAAGDCQELLERLSWRVENCEDESLSLKNDTTNAADASEVVRTDIETKEVNGTKMTPEDE